MLHSFKKYADLNMLGKIIVEKKEHKVDEKKAPEVPKAELR